MRLDIGPKYERVLHVKKDDLGCHICNEKDWTTWYWCTEKERIYCRRCLIRESPHARSDHEDINIDMVKIIHDDDHLRMNEELLK